MPEKMKLSQCTPLYKGKGRRSSSSSYRAIFSLSYITKVFEKIIYERLLNMVGDLMISNQHGFRIGRSCETACALFTQSIYDILDQKSGKALAVFVDFTKAFDTVDHNILLKKLMEKFENKVEPYMIRLISNYYDKRKFQIKNGNFISKVYEISSGSGAGSALGPLAFSIYINDIGEAMSLPFLLYADDLVFYVDATNLTEGLKQIEECYINLQKYCSINKLGINVSKTKVMYFHKGNDYRSKDLVKGHLNLGGCKIEVVQDFKYLGINLDPTLSFKKHYDLTEKKVSVALGKMYAMRRFFTLNILKTFVSCYIMSILDYCITIWCVQTDKQIDYIQDKICRFLRVYFYSKNCTKKQKAKILVTDLLEKADLMKIAERKDIAMIKFICRSWNTSLCDWFQCSSKRRAKESISSSACSAESEKESLSRLIVPPFKSSLSKNSVRYSAIEVWNRFFQWVKPDENYTVSGFIGKCKAELVSRRHRDFIT